jgi:hypothetical protein
MISDNNIHDELRDLNSNLPPKNEGPYGVPEGYFDNLAASVMARIKGEKELSAAEEIGSLSPLLASISRQMPYEVPADYFHSTLQDLPVLVREEEESLVLSFIDKSMPYEVPQGYFFNLPDEILSRINQPAGAKVIPIIRRRWMRLAVAAAVTGIMALSGILYFSKGKSNVPVTSPGWVAKSVQNVSPTALDEFIKTADVTTASRQTAQHKPAKTEVRKMLQDVSDKELDAFLSQVPTDEDFESVN